MIHIVDNNRDPVGSTLRYEVMKPYILKNWRFGQVWSLTHRQGKIELLNRDGRGCYFFQGDKAKNLWGGCSKGNFNLHKVKLIYSTFIILIVITISITIIIITRPKPPYRRQGLAGSWGKDTVRRVHFGAFSTSHFAPSALSSDWIVLI